MSTPIHIRLHPYALPLATLLLDLTCLWPALLLLFTLGGGLFLAAVPSTWMPGWAMVLILALPWLSAPPALLLGGLVNHLLLGRLPLSEANRWRLALVASGGLLAGLLWAWRGRSLLGQPAFLRPVAPPLRLDPRPLNLGVTCVDDGADEPTERSPLPSAVFPFATGNVTWLPPTEWQQIPGRRGRTGEVTPEA